MRETIEKFAPGIVFTAASASSIEWLIEHIDQRPAEVDEDETEAPPMSPATFHSPGVV